MLSNTIRLFYFFIHFILSCYLWSQLLVQQIRDLFTKEEDPESLKKIVSELKKIPTHIGIVSEGPFFQEELAKIICWSICTGISDITVFDPKGLKKQIRTLEESVEKQKQLFFGKSSSAYRVQVGIPMKNQSLCFPKSDASSGSLRSSRKTPFNVNVISHEEGRWDMINFTRKFCVALQDKQVKVKDLTEAFIQENLSSNITEPDLIMLFGPLQTLGGFLPWHIRLSEIFQAHTLRNVHSNTFVSALKHYSRLEQRYGT